MHGQAAAAVADLKTVDVAQLHMYTHLQLSSLVMFIFCPEACSSVLQPHSDQLFFLFFWVHAPKGRNLCRFIIVHIFVCFFCCKGLHCCELE